MLYRIGVLKTFRNKFQNSKSTGIKLGWSLFLNKASCLQLYWITKYFHVNFAKFLRTTFLLNPCGDCFLFFFFLFFLAYSDLGQKKCFLLFCLLIFWYTQLFLLFSNMVVTLALSTNKKKHILDVRLWSWFFKKTCPFVTKKTKQWTVFCFNLTNLENKALLFLHAYHMKNRSASHK